jgi:hypothetical protein
VDQSRIPREEQLFLPDARLYRVYDPTSEGTQWEDYLFLAYAGTDGKFGWLIVTLKDAGEYLSIPYTTCIDGQTSSFNLLDPNRKYFESDGDPEYLKLLRTTDSVTHNTVWIEFDALAGIPTDQIRRRVIEFPPEQRDGEPLPTIVRRDVADYDSSQRDRLPYRELSLDEAALWCQKHLSPPRLPVVLVKDLKKRKLALSTASAGSNGTSAAPAVPASPKTEAVTKAGIDTRLAPREDEGAAAPPASGSRPAPTPPARALAAALDLQKEGNPVSLRAVCERAGVDRANLRSNYPDAVSAIRLMMAPDRTPKRGVRNVRTGGFDAVDDSED